MILKKYLIVYDITKDKQRRKIQLEVEKFGFRWQYSTYYCEVTDNQKKILANNLKTYLGKNDSIIWIPLTDRLLEKINFYGKFKYDNAKFRYKIY